MARPRFGGKVALKVLSSTASPLSVQEIVKRIGSEAHAATIYRSLHALLKSGEVRKVDLGDRILRYEVSARHHHHITCVSCGRVRDVNICLPKGFETKALKSVKEFSVVKDHSLELFALCRKCAASC